VSPYTIIEINTLKGELLYEQPNPPAIHVLDERICWLITDILNDNEARSIGFKPNSALRIDRPAAVKTGTTTNFHDNWTIGYTPDLITGVWVGNTNHEPMRGVTGLSGAGPIWHQFMREGLTGTPGNWFEMPDGLVEVKICALSGLLPSEGCPYTRNEWFIQGTEPASIDNVYQILWVDSENQKHPISITSKKNLIPIIALNLPLSAHPWARENGIPLTEDFNLYPDGVSLDGNRKDIKIITPGNMSRFFIDTSIPSELQKIHIQVAISLNPEKINLWLDGKLLITLFSPYLETWWQLELGDHSLWVEAQLENGDILRSSIINFSVMEKQ
jgi:membrane carboxypeptidase/penicillin-binding protein PbpC